MMDVRILGPLEVERDGDLVDLGGRKQRAVLAVLVLHAREPVSADRLADDVWDGEPPASVDTTLRGYVSGLRKAIEPTRGEPRVLRTTPNGYLLDVTDEQIDARRFERLVADGRDYRASGELDAAVETWTRALERWRGEAFQDFAYDAFAQAEAARLTELRLSCAEELFEARIERGEHAAVIGDLEAFCASHPGREHALASKMLALYRCGRQEDALAAYEDGRRRLADELGVDPSPELREVHQRIVRQDPSLVARQRPPATREPFDTGSVDASQGKQTLTFLLGDVERSTEKLRSLGDEYAGVLEEHRRLLLEAFGAHGGRGVRTWGDGVFAAFDGATDALNAAVATQLALCGANFGDERTLPVRMGLHTGEATSSGSEFVGLSIHLASRIMDAAHGGQVLVSQATKDLVEAEEGSEVGFVDTGAHVLKDFPDPVRLHQAVHPELRRDFPPLRTRTEHTDNLPERLTSFLGRDRDIEEIERELAGARVVTLTGVGGVGKTRLATETGRRLVPRYADGVWLCELAPLDDASAIVHNVASLLGVEQPQGSSKSIRESLLAALGQRSLLLILDNCEHLLTPVAELVEDIVRSSRTVDILATSREALGVEGERARPVRSLAVTAGEVTSLADAMQLFEDRARAVRPDFAVDGGNAADVADICTRLDGIPLAIELAAARVASMSPAQIARRLEEGFHFLRSGRRAAVDRHRTLHGAILWSYTMLTDAERQLFDRLSVFAGGFTLEAAEEVCGRDLGLDVADGLASLVAKSLVEADVSGYEARFDLLETMRQYGQDRLSERGEVDEVLRAHAVYFVGLLEELDERVQVASEDVMPRLAVEFDNLRAAWAWAMEAEDVDLALRFGVRGPVWSQLQYPEMFGWAKEGAALPGAGEHELYPRALITAYIGTGARDEAWAQSAAEQVFDFVDHPDEVRRAPALLFASVYESNRGHLEEGSRWLEEYVRASRASHRPVGERVFGLSAASMGRSNAGDRAGAVALAEEAHALARGTSSALEGLSLYYLGEVILARGEDLERGREHLERAIELFRANEMHFWVGVTLVALASLRARHGDPADALQMFDELVDRWRRLGDLTRQWVTLRNLAELFGRLDLHEPAAVLATASRESASAPPDIGPQGERLAELSEALRAAMGDPAYAATCERARAMTDDELFAYAKAEVARALERSPAEV